MIRNAPFFFVISNQSHILQDALLHAVKEEYVEAVEILLKWEEENHVAGTSYVSKNCNGGST